MTVSCIVSSAGRRLKCSCYGLAKTTQQCEGQEGWKWVVSSFSTRRASGTPRRPSVRYLVNSLPPIIRFQASTFLVYKLNATLTLSFGKTVRPVHRTVLSGADESPACFWMSCCRMHSLHSRAPLQLFDGPARPQSDSACPQSADSVATVNHRPASARHIHRPRMMCDHSPNWIEVYSWNSIDHARSDFKRIKTTSADDQTSPSSDGAPDGTFSKSFGNYCTYLSGREPIESKSKMRPIQIRFFTAAWAS